MPAHGGGGRVEGAISPGMFNFEKLDVWQEAIQFADLVYQLTRAFPTEERFGLTNQMRRAAVSVSSNIAERSYHPIETVPRHSQVPSCDCQPSPRDVQRSLRGGQRSFPDGQHSFARQPAFVAQRRALAAG